VDSYTCELKTARWEHRPEEHLLLFHITANRFLRGMVRLIVGACIQTGIGQITLEEVQAALNEQKTLKKSLSVPPQGLFLTDVKYPYEV
jgi:tRNA pseudouridine38-40 synthase